MLKTHVQKNRLFQSAWARQAGISPKAVANYLKRPTMQIDTMFTICQTLNHNFLREIAGMLPPEMPPQHIPDQSAEIAALQQKVNDLQLQVSTLERALGMVGGR